jgi:hypothetical protein
LADHPLLNSHLVDVAKTLDAVGSAIHGLERFYTTVSLSDTPLLSRLMPDLRPTGIPFPHELVLKDRFRYEGRLSHVCRSLFDGTYGGSRVLVKLCATYNRHAHDLLAAQVPPLAPKLHYFGEVQGGMKVVIMDFLTAKDAHHHFSIQALSPSVRADVEKAKDILHGAGLVFGDLRRPNIMVVSRKGSSELGGMLIDFDWCGEAGKATYPNFLNVSGEIHWPDGVGPGEVMQTGHDDVMFTRL